MKSFNPIKSSKFQKQVDLSSEKKTKIENLNMKYFKLQINWEKTYISSSQTDILKPHIKKKMAYTFFLKNQTLKSKVAFSRIKNEENFYQIPKKIQKENIEYKCMKLALKIIKKKLKFKEKPPEIILRQIIPIELKIKGKFVKDKNILEQQQQHCKNMGYKEISNKLKEELIFDIERMEVMEDLIFNNYETYQSLQVTSLISHYNFFSSFSKINPKQIIGPEIMFWHISITNVTIIFTRSSKAWSRIQPNSF